PVFPVRVLEGQGRPETSAPGTTPPAGAAGFRPGARPLGSPCLDEPRCRAARMRRSAGLRGGEPGRLARRGKARGLALPAAAPPVLRPHAPGLRIRLSRGPRALRDEVARRGRHDLPRGESGPIGMNPRLEAIYARSPVFLQNLYVSLYGRR